MSTNFYELSIRACSGYIILVKKYFHLVPPAYIDNNIITAGRRFVVKEHFFLCMKKSIIHFLCVIHVFDLQKHMSFVQSFL